MIRTAMDSRYAAILMASVVLVLTMHAAFADSSDVSWKVTIKRNGTGANNTVFWPPEIQAMQGDSITWINNDTTAHTITSGVTNHLDYAGKIFDSGILSPGQTYTLKIPKGVWTAYYYFCNIHPWMTGKIDVGVAYLGKSSVFTITTDKNTYYTNDVITISGNVTDTSQIMPLKFQIFDSQKNMVFSGSTNLLPDHKFIYNLQASDSIFRSSDNYKIKAFYGFPATVTDANFYFIKKPNNNQESSLSNFTIPYWVRNNADWWSHDQISNSDFLRGIKFLVEDGDLKTAMPSSIATAGNNIPSWIKNDAQMWANGSISDSEFISTIQYLLDHNVITI